VRSTVGVGLMAVCLGLAGCKASGGGKTAANGGAPKPFLGTEATRTNPTDPAAPAEGVTGLLAGQVVDRFNRRQARAQIQIVDLEDTRQPPPARLDYEADDQGYFTIPGLKSGHHYRLIARVKEGDRLLSGVTLAMPPNPRVYVYLSEDLTAPDTPPVSPPTTLPEKKAGPGKEKKGGGPSASLEPPVRGNPDVNISGGPAPRTDADTAAPPPVDKTKVVDKGGFLKYPDQPVTVPSPGTPKPELPPIKSPLRKDQPPTPAPGFPGTPGATSQVPRTPLPVPSCALAGKRLDNFALYDLNDRPWEYHRDHVGRVVLLQFWQSTSGECLEATNTLVDVQTRYQSYGLEVVGIAYEQGTPAQQALAVRGACGRHGVNYRVLLGTSPGTCPVLTQFGVTHFPTLVLLDEKRDVVWTTDKELDAQNRRELEGAICKHLGLRLP
jgi:hypothetical protein